MRVRAPPLVHVAIVAISIVGLPLAYQAGVTLSEREYEKLQHSPFDIDPGDVSPFTEVNLSGDIDATIACGSEAGVEVAEHPDDLFVRQRGGHPLFVLGRRLSTSERFAVTITTEDRLLRFRLRGGARLEVPGCATARTQITADLEGLSVLSLSGRTADLNYYGATGSSLVAGPDGWIKVEKAYVEVVFGATADLCDTDEVNGTAAAGGSVRVREDASVYGLSDGEVDRDCPMEGEEDKKESTAVKHAVKGKVPYLPGTNAGT